MKIWKWVFVLYIAFNTWIYSVISNVLYAKCACKWHTRDMPHTHTNVTKMPHHLRECMTSGAVVRVPCLLTQAVYLWVVIISLHCPLHLPYKLIKETVSMIRMWPFTLIASPLPTWAKWQSAGAAWLISSVFLKQTDWLTHTHAHAHLLYKHSHPIPCAESNLNTTLLRHCRDDQST